MRYGLALEGGGARGAAHVGVLTALSEERLLPEAVSGTSAGAIVAAAYALRGRAQDAQRALEELGRIGTGILDLNLWGILRGAVQLATRRNFTLDGIFKGNALEKWVDAFTEGAPLAKAALPLVIPATDLTRQRLLVFSSRPPQRPGPYLWRQSGKISQAVRASTALPMLFRPCLEGDAMLVDGGVLENLPVRSLSLMGASAIIGVSLENQDAGSAPPPDDVVGIGMRTIQTMQTNLSRRDELRATYLLRVKLPPDSGLFSLSKLHEYSELGYKAAKAAMPEIKGMLSRNVSAARPVRPLFGP